MQVSIILKLLDGVTAPLRRVQQAVANASKAMEGAKTKAEAAFKQSDHIKHAGEAMSKFAEKSRAVVEAAVGAFEPFEEQMVRVRTLTGASAEQFEAMSEQARLLGSTGRFSAIDAAKGMEQLRTEGFGVNQIMSAMPVLMDAAVVGNTSLEATIGTTAGMLDAFSLDASQVGRALDASTAAAQASGSPLSSMREALAVAGVAANQAGISFERTAVLAGLLAQRNIEGSQAGSTLEKTLKFLKNPTKDAAGFFRTMHVAMTETVDGVQKLRDPLTVLTELQAAMTSRGISATDQLENFTQLLGDRAAPDILAMLEAAKTPGLEKLTAAMAGATGGVARMSAEMRGTGAESARDLGGAMDELKTTFGATMAPAVESLTKLIDGAVRGITTWLKANPGFAQALGYVALAVAGVTTALSGLLVLMASAAATKGVLFLAKAYLGFSGSLVSSVIPAITSAATGMWAMIAPALVAAAPFLAVAAAVGAVTLAIVQLVKAWDTLDMGASWKGLKDAVGDGSVWKTMTINPFSGLGGDSAPAAGAALGPVVPSRAAQPGVPDALARPEGMLRIQIDSEGRPAVKEMKAKGLQLETDAGLMMGL